MSKTYKRGDHVEWNSEAGRVRGVIMKKVVPTLVSRATCTTPRRRNLSTSSRVIRLTTSHFTKDKHSSASRLQLVLRESEGRRPDKPQDQSERLDSFFHGAVLIFEPIY